MIRCPAKEGQTIQRLFYTGLFIFIFFHLPLTSLHSRLLRPGQAVSILDPFFSSYFSSALEDSDLDARDAKNRPVRSKLARSELKQLFVSTVFRLLVSEDLPVVSSVRKFLQELLAPLSQQFRRAFRFIEMAAVFALTAIRESVAWVRTAGILCSAYRLPLTAYHSSLTTHRLPLNLPLRC